MERQECIELGYIAKPHGLKGEVKAVFDVQDIQEYIDRKSFYLAKKDKPLQKFRVKRMNIQQEGQLIVKFEGVNYRDEAEALKGSTIFFPEAELPKLGEGEFYYYQIKGYTILDNIHGELGIVKGVMETGVQDVLVMEYKGKEVLIPLTKEFVQRADHDHKRMLTAMPEGLLEFYLGEEED